MQESTLNEWKKWYSENRSEDNKVVDSIEEEINDDTVLVRLWIAQDGKAPKGAAKYQSKVWENKNSKGITPAKGLIVITATGQSPLLLTSKKSPLLNAKKEKKDGKKEGASRLLSKPYLWRCRDCGEQFESMKPSIHCTRRPRQLAEVSNVSSEWFDKFLNDIEWKYIPHHPISKGQVGVIEDAEADKIAEEAGKSLEKILSEVEMKAPEFFELYNYKTQYLRVSDLKDFKKFKQVIVKIAQWRNSKLHPKNSAPLGIIEIGHSFDELLSSTFENISSEEWRTGERVWFECEELGVTVSGTPDLSFQGIPVETKTLKVFPNEVNEANQQSIFSYKWKANYSKQVALYLQGGGHDWMLLLLISRESGNFTLVPVDDSAMTKMRADWNKWAADKKYSSKLKEYRQLISEEE
jgi:hypothetical protein